MCVRFLGLDGKEKEVDDIKSGIENLKRRRSKREVFPGEQGTIFRLDDSEGELVEARWGLTPEWAGRPNFGKTHAYNARSETIAEKPTFRSAFKHRRAIIPAHLFYERAEGRWLHIEPVETDLFLIAALWEPANEHSDVPTFTMVTTEPNETMAQVHDRMPVVLPESLARAWMDEGTPVEALRELMSPCPPEWIKVSDAGPVARKKKSDAGLFDE